jgi:deoxyguanosine kinase
MPREESGFPRYIAVEGPIGVGKTTLALRLAERLKARNVLEEFTDNPFLREFYADRQRVAFQTQVYFLIARFKQQERLRQQDLFSRAVVSDYLFAKDRVFAYLNLNEHELQLYEKIYDLLKPRLLQPDVVIYLHARPDVLMRRLRRRGREIESSVEVTYLEGLMRAYNDFFHRYDETPLIAVDTSDVNFPEQPDQVDALLEAVRTATAGRQEWLPRTA